MTALPPDDEMCRHSAFEKTWAASVALCPLCLSATISRLRAELSALRADAERYRWLRDMQALMWKPAKYDGLPFGRWDCDLPDGPDLDEAIDADASAHRLRNAAPQAHPGEESAAIPASDSTVPPGDGAAACKG